MKGQVFVLKLLVNNPIPLLFTSTQIISEVSQLIAFMWEYISSETDCQSMANTIGMYTRHHKILFQTERITGVSNVALGHDSELSNLEPFREKNGQSESFCQNVPACLLHATAIAVPNVHDRTDSF